MKKTASVLLFGLSIMYSFAQSYPIIGTNQIKAYNDSIEISLPISGDPYYGQNANFQGITPSYTDNGDGTVTDNNTGLMWQKSADFNNDGNINVYDKKTYYDALADASSFNLASYNDWRLPTIKELYSLFMANGTDPSGYTGSSTGLTPFIDGIFDFGFGDETNGERLIDAQYATTAIYVGTVFNGATAMFGVNFADGRIKGYPIDQMGIGDTMKYYVKYVRGNSLYGINSFQDNGNGTISDNATGLNWAKSDNGQALSWKEALLYADTATLAGYTDWRLPDVKELQSIVDYSRSPTTSSSAAIDPIFNCSQITDEDGGTNYPFYWTSTTHHNWTQTPGNYAMYVAFGQAFGWMEMPPNSGNYSFMDVHGAGAQRSDPKTGNPNNYPYGFGPQGDVIRIFNHLRLVRGTSSIGVEDNKEKINFNIFPNPATNNFTVQYTTKEKSTIQIFIRNTLGQLVYIENPTEKDSGLNSEIINCEHLSAGIYIVSIIFDNEEIVNQKMQIIQ